MLNFSDETALDPSNGPQKWRAGLAEMWRAGSYAPSAVAVRAGCWMTVGMILIAAGAALNGRGVVAEAFAISAAGAAFAAASAAILGPHLPLRRASRRGLGAAMAFWILGPIAAAAPLFFLAPEFGFGAAYFDAAAALTTTGASAYPLGALPPEAALWRALCAWGGGLFALRLAATVFFRLRLGGYEIEPRAATTHGAPSSDAVDAGARLTADLTTAYLTATAAALALGAAMGADPLTAACGAFGGVSTAGLGAHGAAAPAAIQPATFLAMLFGMTAGRRMFRGRGFGGARRVEAKLAAGLILMAAAFVSLGAIRVGAMEDLGDLWRAIYVAASFLATAGYVPEGWIAPPGGVLILLTLSMIGGGAASTAGGLKLLRLALIAGHAGRELTRAIYPNIAAPTSLGGVRIDPSGLRMAWLFMMLHFFALAGAALGLATLGAPFETALAGAVAALSNTGPALDLVDPGAYAAMGGAERVLFCLCMAVGRMEVLAAAALLAAWLRR